MFKFIGIVTLVVFLFNGCSSKAPAPTWKHISVNDNQLKNPSFELNSFSKAPHFWIVNRTKSQSGGLGAHSGDNYVVFPWGKGQTTIKQLVSLQSNGFDLTAIDKGLYSVKFGGYQMSSDFPTDKGNIILSFFDKNKKFITEKGIGLQNAGKNWKHLETTIPLPKHTRYVQYNFIIKKAQTKGRGQLLDDAFLYVFKGKQEVKQTSKSISATYAQFSKDPTFQLNKTAALKVKDTSGKGVYGIYDLRYKLLNNSDIYVNYNLPSGDSFKEMYNASNSQLINPKVNIPAISKFITDEILFKANIYAKVPFIEVLDLDGKQLAKQTISKEIKRFKLLEKNIIGLSDNNIYVYSIADITQKPLIFKNNIKLDDKLRSNGFYEAGNGEIYISLNKKIIVAGRFKSRKVEKIALLNKTSQQLDWLNIELDCNAGYRNNDLLLFEDKFACISNEKGYLNIYNLSNPKLYLKISTDNILLNNFIYNPKSQVIALTALKYPKKGSGRSSEFVLIDMKNLEAKKIKLPAIKKAAESYLIQAVSETVIELQPDDTAGIRYGSNIYIDTESLYAKYLKSKNDQYDSYKLKKVVDDKKQFLIPVKADSFSGKTNSLIINRFEIVNLNKGKK